MCWIGSQTRNCHSGSRSAYSSNKHAEVLIFHVYRDISQTEISVYKWSITVFLLTYLLIYRYVGSRYIILIRCPVEQAVYVTRFGVSFLWSITLWIAESSWFPVASRTLFSTAADITPLPMHGQFLVSNLIPWHYLAYPTSASCWILSKVHIGKRDSISNSCKHKKRKKNCNQDQYSKEAHKLKGFGYCFCIRWCLQRYEKEEKDLLLVWLISPSR